jgi:hypothetical protein
MKMGKEYLTFRSMEFLERGGEASREEILRFVIKENIHEKF